MSLAFAELDTGPIPDFVEPVEAWRVWRVSMRQGRVVLQSLFAGSVWEPVVPLVASCTGGHRSRWAPWRNEAERSRGSRARLLLRHLRGSVCRRCPFVPRDTAAALS